MMDIPVDHLDTPLLVSPKHLPLPSHVTHLVPTFQNTPEQKSILVSIVLDHQHFSLLQGLATNDCREGVLWRGEWSGQLTYAPNNGQ